MTLKTQITADQSVFFDTDSVAETVTYNDTPISEAISLGLVSGLSKAFFRTSYDSITRRMMHDMPGKNKTDQQFGSRISGLGTP